MRGGTDNSEILTEYSGEVDGAAVKNILPGASGSFDATYTVTDDGELRSAVLTGVFYPDTPVDDLHDHVRRLRHRAGHQGPMSNR